MAKFCGTEFVEEFIEIYRNEPCLWFIKSKDYTNRHMRNAAYQKLVNKMKEIDPDANQHTVLKKINNLRSTYNKEYKKVQASTRFGSGSDSIYVPKIPYYHLLDFIKEQNAECEAPNSNITFETEAVNKEKEDNLTGKGEAPTTPFLPPRKRRSVQDKADHVLGLIAKRMETPANSEYDVFGMYVSKKLQSLHSTSPNMYPIVKKLINDAIFEGEMGTLTPYSRIIQTKAPSSSRTPGSTPSSTVECTCNHD